MNPKIEGKESGEWKLVDGIDLIVHIFHPEKRKFYELEKIWSELIPKEKVRGGSSNEVERDVSTRSRTRER